jgi:hypothetical protein
MNKQRYIDSLLRKVRILEARLAKCKCKCQPKPAEYTIQVYSAPATPEGTDVKHCSSKSICEQTLKMAHKEAERYGAAYLPSFARVWIGQYEDVTDIKPDYWIEMGPRKGCHWRAL